MDRHRNATKCLQPFELYTKRLHACLEHCWTLPPACDLVMEFLYVYFFLIIPSLTTWYILWLRGSFSMKKLVFKSNRSSLFSKSCDIQSSLSPTELIRPNFSRKYQNIYTISAFSCFRSTEPRTRVREGFAAQRDNIIDPAVAQTLIIL